MSRARNIKPGFFKNDVLAECQPLARLLFAGLWCEADRAGRLEDRPARIKVECLPYDECDANALLGELADHGFIVRYTANNIKYIQILAFDKHQNPHIREPASSIPGPNEHGASTVQAQCKNGTGHADSPSLIPDSPSRIPDPKKGRACAPKLPDWLPASAWHEWHVFRNARKGWTATARKLSLRTLTDLHTAGHDPRAVIEQSIERGWTGLFPTKTQDARGSPPIAQTFADKTYTGTPDDELPDYLKP